MLKKEQNKKFSLADFVWLGFNYTVGISFIGNFAILANISEPNSIGIHTVWLFAVEGLIAGICAWAFAKMARVHYSNNNGASYIYVRITFGKFWGIFVAFMQYVSLPFLITIQVMMLIRGSFGADWISQVNPDGSVTVPWYAADWGSFGDLWLDFIGIAIYMSAAAIIFEGIKLCKVKMQVGFLTLIKSIIYFLLKIATIFSKKNIFLNYIVISASQKMIFVKNLKLII